MSNNKDIAQQAVSFTDLAELETEQISGGDKFIFNPFSFAAPFGFNGPGFGSPGFGGGFGGGGFGGQQQQQQGFGGGGFGGGRGRGRGKKGGF